MLLVFGLFWLTVVTLNVVQFLLVFVFLCNLSDIDFYGWMAFLTDFFITLIFFRGLSLSLKLTCINRKRIIELTLVFIPIFSVSFVFIFLGWRPITLWALEVNLPYCKDGCRQAFASTSIVFFTTSCHEYSSRLWLSICTQIERYRLLQKYRIKVSLLGAIVGFNSLRTTYKCSRCVAQSRASFS